MYINYVGIFAVGVITGIAISAVSIIIYGLWLIRQNKKK